MVQPKYTPEESLQRIKLMMEYNSSKTLKENENLILEQLENEYFELRAKQLMKYPEKFASLNFGKPTIDPVKSSAAILKTIKGLGTEKEGLGYVIGKSFTSLPNSVAVIKSYPSVGKESLYSAIDGEWFAGGALDGLVSTVGAQLLQWCKLPANAKNKICAVKSKQEMEYGV